VERERRKAHRLKQISEAQAIIEGADMDGLVPHVEKNSCAKLDENHCSVFLLLSHTGLLQSTQWV